MENNHSYNGLEIAIVGISGQFPGSSNHNDFWENLKAGTESLENHSIEAVINSGVSEFDATATDYVRRVGTVPDKMNFDEAFFGYTPREAALLDPQIRLFHQHCWWALEDAGCASSVSKKKIGLFAGSSSNDIWKMYAYSNPESAHIDPFFLNMITSHNFLCTLTSYKLDLRGPSVFIDTACSTSLVAVHAACRSLLTRECPIALAGGVSLKSKQQKGYRYLPGMISSRDGHCRAFDEDASGTAAGEGVGVVVLKRLDDALQNGDRIYSVIRSTYINNDGRDKVGFTAPSVSGQAQCIASAHKLAGIAPQTIGYIEAHGTGTKLGDPIEIRALNEAFGSDQNHCCAIGSVKTNIGHADAASGIAGLIKTILCLQNKKLVPSLNFKNPNPEIEFNVGPFFVNTKLRDWSRDGQTPLRAGVSSFGIGGTNVHVVLEEASPPVKSLPESLKIALLSAKSDTALKRYMAKLSEYLKSKPDIDLDDLSYSLLDGREDFQYRYAIKFENREDLLSKLEIKDLSIAASRKKSEYVFVFPGQGSQYAGMGKGLYYDVPLFREIIDEGLKIAKPETNADLKAILFDENQFPQLINNTEFAQPLIFLIEYALTSVIMAMGIRPTLLIGHSVGEYTAACISGLINFSDTLKILIKRGKIIQNLPKGEMISVAASPDDLQPYICDNISIAALNSPTQTVLSGDWEAVNNIKTMLDAKGIANVRLNTSHAFHSHMVDPCLAEFKRAVGNLSNSEIEIPFVSNLTAGVIDSKSMLSPDYWVRHLREPVRFSDGLLAIPDRPNKIFLHLGPGNTLMDIIRRIDNNRHNNVILSMMKSSRESENDRLYFAHKVMQLWLSGASTDWSILYQTRNKRRISVPGYAFEPNQYPAEVDVRMFNKFNKPLENEGTNTLPQLSLAYWSRRKISGPSGGARNFVIFSDDAAFYEEISSSSTLYPDYKIIFVGHGNFFERVSENRFQVNPANGKDYMALAEALRNTGYGISDLVFKYTANESSQVINENLCFLIEHLPELRQVVSLTKNTQSVTGNEELEQEALYRIDLLNNLSGKNNLPFLSLDFDSDDIIENTQDLLNEVINIRNDRFVAIRNKYRWEMRYEEILVKEQHYFKYGGTYVFAGEVCQAHLSIIKQLIHVWNAKVVLLGYKEDWLAEIDFLDNDRFENLLDVDVDVNNLEDLKEVAKLIQIQLGVINGVVANLDCTKDQIEPCSFGKVCQILNNIAGAFSQVTPDFICFTSLVPRTPNSEIFYRKNCTISNLVQNISNSTVAYKFMFLQGSCRDDIEATQMLCDHITPLFETMLIEQSTVCKVNIAGFADLIQKKNDRSTDIIPDEIGLENRSRPDLSTGYSPPVTETEIELTKIFEDFLMLKVGIDDDFFELGGDSLKGMMLLNRIQDGFKVKFKLDDIFSGPSVRKISERIDEITNENDNRLEHELLI